MLDMAKDPLYYHTISIPAATEIKAECLKTRKDFYLRRLSVLCLGHLGSYQDVPKWRAVYRKETDIQMLIFFK